MSELELLDAIAHGQTTFCRAEFPDLNEIDVELRLFGDVGYVPRVVRAVVSHHGISQVERVDVMGGLTPVGEMRRRQLFPLATQPAAGLADFLRVLDTMER